MQIKPADLEAYIVAESEHEDAEVLCEPSGRSCRRCSESSSAPRAAKRRSQLSAEPQRLRDARAAMTLEFAQLTLGALTEKGEVGLRQPWLAGLNHLQRLPQSELAAHSEDEALELNQTAQRRVAE